MRKSRPTNDGVAERLPRACRELGKRADILAAFADDVARLGLVGETRVAKALYLALTSRLLPEPVSVAVKGPSSAGKSYLTEQVLRFFPASAYFALTGMSEMALIYLNESLTNRFIVVYEAAGLKGESGNVFIRSLLTEAHVRYGTVDKSSGKLGGRLIEREGPTGLLLTTTDTRLHPEFETRLFSIGVMDTQEQTRRILHSTARDHEPGAAEVELEPWLALQTWLEQGELRVVIPYAPALAEEVPPVAVRLRRDFPAVLNLIRAHALLHRARRERDEHGRIVATLDDYAAVRELVAAEVAHGAETSVSESMRETVEAARRMTTANKELSATHAVSVSALAAALGIDKSSASRRVRSAVERGYLVNQEDRPGKAAKIALGEPLPQDVEILPTVATITKRWGVARKGGRPVAKAKVRGSRV